MFKYRILEGKNPKTGIAMFYGIADKVNAIKASDICREIAHSCTVTEADVKGLLAEVEKCILGHLQNNESVRLGTFGSFCPRMKSSSATSAALFLPENIKGMGVSFTPSHKLKAALRADNPDVKFKLLDGE